MCRWALSSVREGKKDGARKHVQEPQGVEAAASEPRTKERDGRAKDGGRRILIKHPTFHKKPLTMHKLPWHLKIQHLNYCFQNWKYW